VTQEESEVRCEKGGDRRNEREKATSKGLRNVKDVVKRVKNLSI
jgi:hypothetical protein